MFLRGLPFLLGVFDQMHRGLFWFFGSFTIDSCRLQFGVFALYACLHFGLVAISSSILFCTSCWCVTGVLIIFGSWSFVYTYRQMGSGLGLWWVRRADETSDRRNVYERRIITCIICFFSDDLLFPITDLERRNTLLYYPQRKLHARGGFWLAWLVWSGWD